MEQNKKYLQIPMKKELYNRENCRRLAASILSEGKITGMSLRQLYFEIFAHAYVYYNFHLLPRFLRESKMFKSIYNSASDGVDLEDDGDSKIRRIAYVIIWFLPAFRIK